VRALDARPVSMIRIEATWLAVESVSLPAVGQVLGDPAQGAHWLREMLR
jgi:hypothetical protein